MMNYALLLLALKTWSLLHNCIGLHATTIQKSTYSFDDTVQLSHSSKWKLWRVNEKNPKECWAQFSILRMQRKQLILPSKNKTLLKEKCCHFTKLNHDNLTWGFCLEFVHEGTVNKRKIVFETRHAKHSIPFRSYTACNLPFNPNEN